MGDKRAPRKHAAGAAGEQLGALKQPHGARAGARDDTETLTNGTSTVAPHHQRTHAATPQAGLLLCLGCINRSRRQHRTEEAFLQALRDGDESAAAATLDRHPGLVKGLNLLHKKNALHIAGAELALLKPSHRLTQLALLKPAHSPQQQGRNKRCCCCCLRLMRNRSGGRTARCLGSSGGGSPLCGDRGWS